MQNGMPPGFWRRIRRRKQRREQERPYRRQPSPDYSKSRVTSISSLILYKIKAILSNHRDKILNIGGRTRAGM